MPSQRKKPFPMMSAAVKLCKLLGLWHDTNLHKPCWQAVLVISGLLFWYILPGVIFIIRKEKTLEVQLKPILEVISMTVLVFRFTSYMIHRGELQKCYQDLQMSFTEFEDSPYEDIRQTLRHLKKSADYLVKIYVSIVLIQALLYGMVPAVLTIFKYITMNEVTEFPATVLEADFVFFDHLSNFWIWLPILVVSVSLEYLMVGSFAANDTIMWNLLHHVSCLFKIVRIEISRLDQYKDPELFKEQLRYIVHAHEVCYRCARCLERVLNPVMALLYVTCIFQTCYIMFVVSLVDDLILIGSMVFVLQYCVFLIFTISMLGTELMEESSQVSNAIYNMRWYDHSVVERRLLLFMQMRSNQVVGITAGKFFVLNRSTFARAMQTAFSYFTVMQRFYGEN